jgi:CRP-like cAMP-binding protein
LSTVTGVDTKRPASSEIKDARHNAILGALPDAELSRLMPSLELVSLARGEVLEEPHEEIHYAYFPTEGIASVLALGPDGESVDTTMIGREGMTGIAVFLGTGQMPVRTMVQLPLTAFRLPSEELRAELARGGRLVNLALRYTQVVMVSLAQLILCNRIHRLDQRAARWLLQVDERVAEAPFGVTQEFLAQMLGTQRPSLTLAVRQFKDAGFISYSRGRLSITDRDGLLSRSCGCIWILHDEEQRLRDTAETYDITAS